MAEFTGRLANAPVVYVLTQIRFSAVLKMEEYVPAIQEQLRGDYPRFERQQTHQIGPIEIGPQGQTISPSASAASRWVFRDKADVSGFILDQSSLVFHTSKYADFPEFRDRLMVGASIVQETAKIPLVERVGLRYVDLIMPEENETLDQYVNPGLVGFSISTLDKDVNQQYISAPTKLGQIVVRFTKAKLSSPLPPDLSMLAPRIQRKPKSNRVSAILDTDHFSEKSMDFDHDRLARIVTDLQAPVADIFKSAITDHAVQKWR